MNNLLDYYTTRCDKWNHKKLFDGIVSYSESLVLAKKRAAFLQEQGFSKGDVIGIMASSSREWCLTYMSITVAGMIVLPLDTNIKGDDLKNLLTFSEAKAVFVSEEYTDLIKDLTTFMITFDSAVDDESKFKDPAVDMEFPASLVCTSGTTGKPKFAVLTHKNIIRTSIANCEYVLESDDHFLCILPLFHVYAFVANFIGPFAIGCSFSFLPSLKGPDIIKKLSEEEFTCFPAAPQLWEIFFDGILAKVKAQSKLKALIFIFFLKTGIFFRRIGLSLIPDAVFAPIRNIFGKKMRFFISGGAPLKKWYYNYYRAMGLKIVEGYGLTETTGPVMLSNSAKTLGKVFKPGSVGKVVPGNQLKLKSVNSEGIGEVWIKGDSVFSRYFKNDEATKEAFDQEWFFNTGDIGRLDKDGDLFLTGRMKNTIVLDSGKNVYPDEIEAILKKSTIVSDVFVFGKKINGRETVCAVIVPSVKKSDSFSDVAKAVALINNSLPSYKRIGKIAVSSDPLPKNSARKTVINEVKRMFEDGYYQTDESDGPRYSVVLKAGNEKEEIILEVLKKKTGLKELFANISIFDLGIDSLGLIELIVQYEEILSISIDQKKIQSLSTLEELFNYISACPEKAGMSIDDSIVNSEITTKIRSFANPFNSIFIQACKVLSRICWNFECKNAEYLATENSIIAANHGSNADPVWIFISIPAKHRKNVYITGKRELFFLKYIFAGAPLIFIEREGNALPALKASADVLREGKSLLIFPEGTRTSDGSLGEFKSGAAYLSKKLGKKIVPVRINGSFEIYPKTRLFPNFFSKSKGELLIGKPIDPSDYQSIDKLNAALRKAISELK